MPSARQTAASKGRGRSLRTKSKAINPTHPIAAFQVRRFIAQHGRLRGDLQTRESQDGRRGWWELSAADGYRLRCDWSRDANEERIDFTRIAPPERGGAKT